MDGRLEILRWIDMQEARQREVAAEDFTVGR
jgi:hypothetical protein